MNNKFNFAEKCFSLFCKKKQIHSKAHLSQANLLSTQINEWKKYWGRFCIPIPSFKNKIIVDYGCGFGYDSLFVLQNGAKHIYCLEVSKKRLKQSEELHISHGFKNVTYINNTNIKDLQKKIINHTVDMIFSRDVMEHVPSPFDMLESMNLIIKSEGEIYIGFSPLYKSPYGPHFGSKCRYPWIHLIFSEKTILNVFKKLYKLPEKINTYQQIEGSGVNKLTYYDYKKMLNLFHWDNKIDKINSFQNRPFLMMLLNFIVTLIPTKKLKEFFIINSYIKLKKHSK